MMIRTSRTNPGPNRDRQITTAVVVTLAGAACLAHAGESRFTLVTQQAGLANSNFIPAPGYPPENAIQTGGASVGDFNNDSWPDLFLPAGGTGPDRLFINQRDGTFRDEAAAWGVDRRTRSAGSAVADFNNDGLVDLFIVNYGDFPGPAGPGRCILYQNLGPDAEGQWRFADVAAQAGVNEVLPVSGGMGAAFGDYNLDGHLDLFVSTWIFEPGGNRLFRNDGDGTFTDASDTLPAEPFPLRGFTPNFADIDDDGWPDLLLTNDFNTSRLYRNTGRDGGFLFEDITQAAGITQDCNGMGSTLADFDADGVLDWFVTNIYLEVGSPPCANTLYRGLGVEGGVPRFADVAADAGVGDAGWGWGVTAIDADNDGRTDLAVTGGWPGFPATPARLFMNDGDGASGPVFTDEADAAGLAWSGQGRGLVHLDYNKDGRPDLLFVNNGSRARLYRNDTPDAGRFLRLDVDASTHPCLAPKGVGARVTVTAGGRVQTQLLDSRTTYLGQSEQTLHFGLGDAASADTIEIRWADGSRTTLQDVPADQTITVAAYHDADANRDGRLNFFDLLAFLQSFNANDPGADFNGDAALTVLDLIAFADRLRRPCG